MASEVRSSVLWQPLSWAACSSDLCCCSSSRRLFERSFLVERERLNRTQNTTCKDDKRRDVGSRSLVALPVDRPPSTSCRVGNGAIPSRRSIAETHSAFGRVCRVYLRLGGRAEV